MKPNNYFKFQYRPTGSTVETEQFEFFHDRTQASIDAAEKAIAGYRETGTVKYICVWCPFGKHPLVGAPARGMTWAVAA